ncbi:MAG: ferritin family protein [Proteobacteria bacterium]|nr:ferritin family protein [Pseudomonadota bacterium]
MFSIQDIIDIAVRIEENGEQFFRNAQKNTKNPELFALLQWLADEEVEHARWFKNLKDAGKKPIENPGLEKMGRALLRDSIGEMLFALDEADLSDMQQTEDLLNLAIEFEKDTVLFFKMLLPFIEDPETLNKLNAIIGEEEQHIQKLKEFLTSDL